MSEIRLQKYLAECGVASRRKAEELISQGRVSVNGILVTEMGCKVSFADRVEVDGKAVSPENAKVYILLNKPVGYVTTAKDQFARKTVLDLIEGIDERIYPVGRLDYDTSGLLLLTNDGEFTYRLTHPKHELTKIYIADVKGVPTEVELERFKKGLKIEDYFTSPANIKILEDYKSGAIIEVRIHEGRNRQVRKMCEAIGHEVKKLKRVAMGRLELGSLQEGNWRFLSQDELKLLD